MVRIELAWVCALLSASAFAHVSAVEAQVPGEAVTVVDPIDIPPERDPLAHAWELPGQRGGFYLRATTSIGAHNARIGPADWEADYGYTVNGFGSGYGLDLGGFVRPWLALHADATFGVLWNGDLTSELDVAGRLRSARILAYGIAPAVTFITPHDFYLKPAFGIGWATVKQGGDSETTDPGFYMHLVAGKDLYVDEHFSFGLHFEIVYLLLSNSSAEGLGVADSAMSAFEDDMRVRQFLFGVSFSFDSR